MVLMGMATMADIFSDHELKPSVHTHQLCDPGQVTKMYMFGWLSHIFSLPIHALLDALKLTHVNYNNRVIFGFLVSLTYEKHRSGGKRRVS